jgi:hypothetical protein
VAEFFPGVASASVPVSLWGCGAGFVSAAGWFGDWTADAAGFDTAGADALTGVAAACCGFAPALALLILALASFCLKPSSGLEARETG